MASNELSALFKCIWLRAKQLPSLEMLTPALVEQWAKEKYRTVHLIDSLGLAIQT